MRRARRRSGRDGYWTVGSEHYTPQEMATSAQFTRHPEAVWGWYLYRRGLCLAAQPNAAHAALVDLERALGDRFVLLTQNVDGLHLRAGSGRRSRAADAAPGCGRTCCGSTRATTRNSIASRARCVRRGTPPSCW